MGSLEPESESKAEFDDSGCVQDEPMSLTQTSTSTPTQLLDLSDDVLLYILRHCSPRDLKALGFTCTRLAALCVDRTLWQRVDARAVPSGPARAAWLLDHALTPATTELLITGFAREVEGCLGVVNQRRKDAMSIKAQPRPEQPRDIITADPRNNTITVTPGASATFGFRINDEDGPANGGRAGFIIQGPDGNAIRGQGEIVIQQLGNLPPGVMEQVQGLIGEQEFLRQPGAGANAPPVAAPVAGAPQPGAPQPGAPQAGAPQAGAPQAGAPQAGAPPAAVQGPARPVAPNPLNRAMIGPEIGIQRENGEDLTIRIRVGVNMPNQGPMLAHVNVVNDNLPPMNTEDSDSNNDRAVPKANGSGAGPSKNPDDKSPRNEGQKNGHDPKEGSPKAGSSKDAADKSGEPERREPLERSRPRIMPQEKALWEKSPALRQEDQVASTSSSQEVVPRENTCPGPLFTFTPKMMKQLTTVCPNLVTLALEYCNINCQKIRMSQFPRTLKNLSFKGVKCYNLPMDKCFLFKIQDFMPHLEYLDVSECEWLEPAAILGLSKSPALKHLILRDCCGLTEFVAYASLASRYGFKKLETFDLRGSPLSDSEVSAFSWIPCLRELYVSAAPRRSYPPDHTHYRDDTMPPHMELEPWEDVEAGPWALTEPEPEHQEALPSSKSPSDPQRGSDEEAEDPEAWQNSRWPSNDPSRYVVISPRRRRGQNAVGGGQSAVGGGLGAVGGGQSTVGGGQNAVGGGQSAVGGGRNAVGKGQKSVGGRQNEGPKDLTKRSNPDSQKKENGRDDGAGPSKRFKNTDSGTSKTKRQNDDSSEDDDTPSKKIRRSIINEGASTSKSASESAPNTQRAIRFRRNADPEVVYVPNPDSNQVSDTNPQDTENEPLHKILYVNVSRRQHTVYRLSMPVCTVINSDDNQPNDVVRRGRNISSLPSFLSTNAVHLDNSSLVTDIAIRAFGESDTENVNYIQIGPNGPSTYNRRPVRTNLTVLSVTGFRNITDRSLRHLITAAPFLRFLDLTRTSVTERGVAMFRAERPECEVVFSRFIEKKE